MVKHKRIFRGRNRSYGPTGGGFYGMAREHECGGGGNSLADVIADCFCTILIALLIISFAVTFTLNFRTLYASDVKSQDIPSRTGYSEQDIFDNYDTLISYNSVFHRASLDFPTLEMSDSGRTHFKEVKVIFDALQIVLIIAAIGALVLLFLRRRQAGRLLLAGGVLTLAVPVMTLLIFLIAGWQRFFTGFHKLFFGNDLWIFDPDTDPVIRILPDIYFMHCLIMIIAIVLGLGVLLIIAGAVGRKRSKPKGGWESRYSSDGVKM
jgi:integral membrane protein (TIGR01906 family)